MTRRSSLLVVVLCLAISPAYAAEFEVEGFEPEPQPIQKADGDKEAFLLKKLEACGCGSVGGALAVVACMVAIGAAKWLASETDYLSPSSFFTMTRHRSWKLPHEQYEAELLAGGPARDREPEDDEVFRPEG